MSSLSYLLIASLYLFLFYGCYALLFRRNTFLGLNRAYLLGSVGLSLLLPLIKLPAGAVSALPVNALILPTFTISQSQSASTLALTTSQWIWLLYGLGVSAMLLRLMLNLRAVFALIKRGTVHPKADYVLVRLPNNSTSSFSFGPYLVLNQTDSQTEPAALLRHEEAHIRQYHTADILFLEIVQVAFWFNPVLFLYKRALQEVHEFLADRFVLKTSQPDYPQQLVAYALNVPPTALITPFVSKSTLKQRIIMLQKPQTHGRALLGYALALPLAACLVMCTQSEREQPQSEVGRARLGTSSRAVKVEGKIYDLVDEVPQFPGGKESLYTYLGDNLKYPAAAEKAAAQGTVFVNFIITKDGEITDVKSLKKVGLGMDEEAIRVVSQMPKWIPAKQAGKVVNMRFNLPIRFVLEEPEAKKSAFFSVPTNDADIQQAYKHFFVNGKEVAFDEFRTYDKANILEASASEQSIRLQTN